MKHEIFGLAILVLLSGPATAMPTTPPFPTQPVFNGRPVGPANLPTQPVFNGHTYGTPYVNTQPNPNFYPSGYYRNPYYGSYGYGYGYGFSGADAAAPGTTAGSPPGYDQPATAVLGEAPQQPVQGAAPIHHSFRQRQVVGHVVGLNGTGLVIRTGHQDVTLYGPTPADIHMGDLVIAWALDNAHWTQLTPVR